LLAVGDESSVRYACLELRFSIEYLTYDQLKVHLDEMPDDSVKRWSPKQVIESVLEVAPDADKSVTIAVGVEPAPGVAATQMQSLARIAASL